MDHLTAKERSAHMAKIRHRGNRSTELRLIALFRELGVRGWRRGARLPGKPDFTFRSPRIAIFVDGCFWHGCPIHGRIPKSNIDFWDAKIERNKARDLTAAKELRRASWTVFRLWEHELRPAGRAALKRRLKRLGLITPGPKPAADPRGT